MEKKDFAFDKWNYILLAIGMVVVILGFILMSGGESTYQAFDPGIFDARHTKVAPVVCLIGFITMIFAVIKRPKE